MDVAVNYLSSQAQAQARQFQIFPNPVPPTVVHDSMLVKVPTKCIIFYSISVSPSTVAIESWYCAFAQMAYAP